MWPHASDLASVSPFPHWTQYRIDNKRYSIFRTWDMKNIQVLKTIINTIPLFPNDLKGVLPWPQDFTGPLFKTWPYSIWYNKRYLLKINETQRNKTS